MRKMRLATELILMVLFVMEFGLAAQAKEFQVIVHPSNPVDSLASDQLSRLLLKKTTSWKHGGSVLPIDLASSSKVRVELTKQVHRKSVSSIKSFWQQRIFSGRAVPPPELQSDTEVVAFVKRNPGAVGYISSAAVLEGVKAVTIRN